jgi:hypothetical protein
VFTEPYYDAVGALLLWSVVLIAISVLQGRYRQIPSLVIATITVPLFATYYWDRLGGSTRELAKPLTLFPGSDIHFHSSIVPAPSRRQDLPLRRRGCPTARFLHPLLHLRSADHQHIRLGLGGGSRRHRGRRGSMDGADRFGSGRRQGDYAPAWRCRLVGLGSARRGRSSDMGRSGIRARPPRDFSCRVAQPTAREAERCFGTTIPEPGDQAQRT